VQNLPVYLAFEVNRKKRELINAGVDVIDFGVGTPDQPTPEFVVDAMAEAIRDPQNHRYALAVGVPEFREAAARSMAERFGVKLDPDSEILTLIGAKDAIGHLPLAFVDPGDVVLVPDPGYPAYTSGCILAGGRPVPMPLVEEDGWLPRLRDIPADARRDARILYLNYPNNPTGGVATRAFFAEAVRFAREHEIVLVHDAPYIDFSFADPAPSILETPGAMDVAIEVHSLSKNFNMTGWRIGFAAGNAAALSALGVVKSNVDAGPFKAIQWAACHALRQSRGEHVTAMRDRYRRRRDALVTGLESLGIKATPPRGAFYLWAPCPAGINSLAFAGQMLDKAAVTVLPGVAFGASGDAYFRMSLTVPEQRIGEAIERMNKALT
jgi:LL-diaminopimelate aminotransferase